jgi:hypothetical protein
MKTISFIQFAILGLAFTTLSCKKDKDKDPDTFIEDRQVAVDANRADFESDDISGLEEEIMEKSSVNFGRIAAVNDTFNYECATVTVIRKTETLPGKVTVNFGTGCQGEDGRIRKGIIEWTFTDRIRIPEAVIITSFMDYGVKKATGDEFVMIDNISKKTTTNTSTAESNDAISLKREIDMKMKLSDGTTFTHAGTKNITVSGLNTGRWTRTHKILQGSAVSGTDRKGRAYTQTATTDIVRNGACAKLGFYKPVSGIMTITHDNKTKVVDFGNGNCDGEVSVTINGKLRKSRW